jgi:hypothetical protein
LIEPLAHGLADTPLDTIANHRAPNRPWKGKPDPGALNPNRNLCATLDSIHLTSIERRKVRTRVTGAVLIHSPEIFGA